MRIATWNVNSVRTRLDQVLAWLEQERPEVLCLQETKVADDSLSRWRPSRGWAMPWRSVARRPTTASPSSAPCRSRTFRWASPPCSPTIPKQRALSEQKRVISAWIDGVRILNLYVPNGSALKSEKYPYKLAWLSCLQRYLDVLEDQGEPLCVVGDFNIGLEDRDLHDPGRLSGGIMASEPERQALRQVLAERLVDAFRLFEPEAGHWSWWDYRSGGWERDRGWRIDHIYLDEELQARATGCVIHKQLRGNVQPSDHAPVVVNLAWPPDEQGDDD